MNKILSIKHIKPAKKDEAITFLDLMIEENIGSTTDIKIKKSDQTVGFTLLYS